MHLGVTGWLDSPASGASQLRYLRPATQSLNPVVWLAGPTDWFEYLKALSSKCKALSCAATNSYNYNDEQQRVMHHITMAKLLCPASVLGRRLWQRRGEILDAVLSHGRAEHREGRPAWSVAKLLTYIYKQLTAANQLWIWFLMYTRNRIHLAR